MHSIPDPFREQRRASGTLECPFKGEKIVMLLRHDEVRRAAKDWQTFSSDAPFRVPIPSEEDMREMRQLPIETDPPDHGEYRAIVEPFFQRPKDPAFIARVERLISGLLDNALSRSSIEVVQEFALPLQSRALTYLLNVPESEAEVWIGWGVHVFHAGDGVAKGQALADYLEAQFRRAEAAPGDDFFSALVTATFRGRALTHAERMGFANLVFAGGRDTVIHTISRTLAYLAANPEQLEYLRQDPARIVHACEEFFRVFMPLTHIGRVCPHDTNVNGVTVPAGSRISLGWAAANFDESVFTVPEEVRLDRRPNPHLSFGFGPHLCLGAGHARLLLRTLLRLCCERVGRVECIDARPRVEHEQAYDRSVGYDSLVLKLSSEKRKMAKS